VQSYPIGQQAVSLVDPAGLVVLGGHTIGIPLKEGQ
jgi:hypothetical protein